VYGAQGRTLCYLCQSLVATVCFRQSKLEKARVFANAGYRSFKSRGSKHGAANCQRWIGLVACAEKEAEEAERLFTEASGVYNSLGLPYGIAEITLAKAHLAQLRGNWTEAEGLAQEALERHTRLGCRKGMAFSHLFLAQLYREQGDLRNAAVHGRYGKEIFAYLGNDVEGAVCEKLALEGSETCLTCVVSNTKRVSDHRRKSLIL
jgi:tetratricopeptide (TPR) repeat protein